jgi:Fe-S oxidoreductase
MICLKKNGVWPGFGENPAAGLFPRPGRPEDQTALGLPAGLVSDWPERFLAVFGRLLKERRSFRLFLDVCGRCGLCAEACPVFRATGDPRQWPMARAELARSIYRRYFTLAGSRLTRGLAGAQGLSHDLLWSWFVYFHQCLTCRQCALACPYGIDTSEITLACREIMAAIGLTAAAVSGAGGCLERTGHHLGLEPRQRIDLLAAREWAIFAETGVAVRLPVDVPGSDILLVPASEDYGGDGAGLDGYAKMLHVAGLSWTLSSVAADGDNYGLFLGHASMRRTMARLMEAAVELGVKKIVWGESGHGWRTAGWFTDDRPGGGGVSGRPRRPLMVHICDLTAELLDQGAFFGRIDPAATRELVVTYHDPCQMGRGVGCFETPRRLLRAVCGDFREMAAETIRENTLCCGAGGGLLDPEAGVLRRAVASQRISAMEAVGANYLATTCGTCRNSLAEALGARGGKPVVAGGVMDLFGRALTPYLKALGLPADGVDGDRT